MPWNGHDTTMSIVLLEECDLGPSSEPILRGVSLAIGTGEFWAIVGPNGSGKTTLLRSLLGLLPPLSGRVAGPEKPNFGRKVAYVPQQIELSAALPTTPREWVRLGLTRLGLSRATRHERVQEALALMGLENIALRDLSRLSTGQRQRALVARALARKAELVVLDEPTEGLDGASRDILLDALDAHHAGGGSVVFVTHRHEEIGARAQFVAVLDEGRAAVQKHA